ncbi:MAG: Cys-tRNA(Pro)/Cys-tRNA(Cys) deacylase [Frankiales bacterium]|jgi:prolyl-tRNA editing enzyme YbaK/EbsC (Cys-tRNA(Pro) deacylase)|nr:Cys-tRNA(Pro)/Cys-tRNA(Cys) deacylase [Frankiales bacterium]
MKGALDIHRELLGRDIPHEILRLARAVVQADEIASVLGIDPDQAVSVRLYIADERMIAVAVPSCRTPVRAAVLRAARSHSLRVATAQEINECTDYAAGLVAPLLLPEEVPLFADALIGRNDVVYTATGDTGTALGISTADLLIASSARVADLTGESLADSMADSLGEVLDLEV